MHVTSSCTLKAALSFAPGQAFRLGPVADICAALREILLEVLIVLISLVLNTTQENSPLMNPLQMG